MDVDRFMCALLYDDCDIDYMLIVNESVNESIVESVNESIVESVNESIVESVNESIVESVSESVSESVNESINRYISKQTNKTTRKNNKNTGKKAKKLVEAAVESVVESVSDRNSAEFDTYMDRLLIKLAAEKAQLLEENRILEEANARKDMEIKALTTNIVMPINIKSDGGIVHGAICGTWSNPVIFIPPISRISGRSVKELITGRRNRLKERIRKYNKYGRYDDTM